RGQLRYFFSSRRRHTRFSRDWSSDVCSSDLATSEGGVGSSLGNALAGLGISTEATQETARTASEIDQMRDWQPVAWLASLGIVRSEERRVVKDAGARSGANGGENRERRERAR